MAPSLQDFFNLSPDLACIRTRDGHLIELSPAWTSALGWTCEELKSRPWIEFVHQDDVAATDDIEHLCLNTQAKDAVIKFTHRFLHRDGHYCWLAWRLLPYQDGFSLGVAQDVTQKSWSGNPNSRYEIQEAFQLRDQAIAASSVGIVIADARLPDMPLIYVNPAFEQMTGYSAAEVLGTNCRFLQGKETGQAGVQQLRAAIDAEEDCTVVLRNYRKDGTLFWNELNISPIHNEEGQLTHFVGVQTNITARKHAEVALRQETEKSEKLLLNILPKPIAEKLKQSQLEPSQQHQGALIADSFESATILFADIVGFTEIASRISPKKLVVLLNTIFSAFDDLSESYGLEKIKTIGDEYMVVGGVPDIRPDHAAAIANLALEMQEVITMFRNDLGEPFQIRIGIHTGAVVAGIIGTRKFIYDLWGNTVNVASRMETQGEPGRIQVTAETYEQLKDQYKFEARDPIWVKGKGEMLTYWLTGKTP